MKPFVLVIVSVLLWSCYNTPRPETPKRLLSEDEMVNVLTDIALVSSAKGINLRTLEKNNVNVSTFVYEKYAIDSAIFAQNNIYYAFDTKTYTDIYNRVQQRLKTLRDQHKALLNKEKKQDSIVKAKRRDSINLLKAAKRKNSTVQ